MGQLVRMGQIVLTLAMVGAVALLLWAIKSLVAPRRRHRVLRRGGVCPFVEGARLVPSLVHRRLTRNTRNGAGSHRADPPQRIYGF